MPTTHEEKREDSTREHHSRHWHLIKAQKISHYSKTGKESVWKMTFVNADGMQLSAKYVAEHRSHSRNKSRNELYPAGSAGIVKRLTRRSASPELPPVLALKSRLTPSQTVNYRAALAEDFVTLYKADKRGQFNALSLMRAFGLDAIAVKRHHKGETKYAIVSSYIGTGHDLYEVNTPSSLVQRAIASSSLDNITRAFCRYLGRLYYCQRTTGRPMIDIKCENIMPVFDKSLHLLDLIPIDLDSSIGAAVNYTLECLSPADASIIAKLFRKKAVTAADVKTLPLCIDYHSAANILAEILNAVEPQLFAMTETKHTLSDKIFYDYRINKVSVRCERLIKLFQLLQKATATSDLPDLLKQCFGAKSDAFQHFVDTIVECGSNAKQHRTVQRSYKSRYAAPKIVRNSTLPGVFRPIHHTKPSLNKDISHCGSVADIRKQARTLLTLVPGITVPH